PQGIRELPPVAIDDERDAMRVAYRPGASLADLADGERTRPLVVEFDGAQVEGATLGRVKHVPHITLRGGTVAQGDSGTIGAFVGQRITLDGMRALGGRQVVSPNFAAAWAVNCAAVGSFNAF